LLEFIGPWILDPHLKSPALSAVVVVVVVVVQYFFAKKFVVSS
jgi:hypothetical protein